MTAPPQPLPPDGGPTDIRWLMEHLSGVAPPPAPPAAPGLKPLEVIGDDDRQRVLDPSLPPFRMVCSIVAVAVHPDGMPTIGSGFLVGPNTVLTAAHVLRNLTHPTTPAHARRVKVTAARDDTSEPFGHVVVDDSAFRFHPDWVPGEAPEHDIAAIRLPRRLGDETSWFWLGDAPLDDARLTRQFAAVAGYPATVKIPGVAAPRGKHLYFDRNILKAPPAGGRSLEYETDSSAGQSGGPVYLWPDPDGRPGIVTAVGVHAYGDRTGNAATRIDAANHARVRQWIADDMAG